VTSSTSTRIARMVTTVGNSCYLDSMTGVAKHSQSREVVVKIKCIIRDGTMSLLGPVTHLPLHKNVFLPFHVV
jgi:hypothetical protein